MATITVVGTYKLSDKAIAKEGNKWCEYTGVSSPQHTAALVIHSTEYALGKNKIYHFFYFDLRTGVVTGAPEYRKLDSYFTKIDDVKPYLPSMYVRTALDEVRGLQHADIKKHFST